MRSQIERNKEILCDEIEKLSKEKMSDFIAEKLSAYRGAYKALCMAEEKARTEYGDQSDYYTQSHTAYPMACGKGHKYGGQMPFSYNMSAEWTRNIKNSDGSKGPHFSIEQVQQVMEEHGIECDLLQFFAVLNSVYSDYCTVAKKYNVSKMDFYVDLAKAWLEDADAVEDKAAKYFEYIVKH